MSENNKSKVEKSFNRLCPDCEEGKLVKVLHKEVREGVTFTDEFVECPVCGYTEKLKISKKEQKESLILKGREPSRKKDNPKYSKRS